MPIFMAQRSFFFFFLGGGGGVFLYSLDGLPEFFLHLLPGHRRVINRFDESDGVLRDRADGLRSSLVVEPSRR